MGVIRSRGDLILALLEGELLPQPDDLSGAISPPRGGEKWTKVLMDSTLLFAGPTFKNYEGRLILITNSEI